jgi:group I intron endonuclease
MFQVYQIENTVNNMYYVGLHNGDIYFDNYYGSGKLITRAVKKHGKEIFDRQVIATFTNKELAKWFEKCLVGISVAEDPMSYNLVAGSGGYTAGEDHPMFGTKRPPRSSEWKKKISLSQTGSKHHLYGKKRPKHSKLMSGDSNPMKRPEVRKKLSGKGNGMYGVPSPMKGKKRPEHSKLLSKEVIKLDLNGNLIQVYPSITIAAKEHNISTASLSYCCSGKTKTSAGFKWKFKNLEI